MRSQTPISSQPAVANNRDRSESPSIMATPRRSKRTASRQSSPSVADSAAPNMAFARRQPAGASVLPIVQVKQSFAYGSPGTPAMPTQISMDDDSRPAAETIAAGIQEAQERDRRNAAGESKERKRPGGSETGRGQRPPRRLSPIRESPGHEAPPLREPEGGRSFLGEGGRSFLGEGGVFEEATLFGLRLIRGFYQILKRVLKPIFILGLVLTPLWAGWLWGPFLVNKLDMSRVSERLSWPSAGSHQDVSAIFNRVLALEKSLKDINLVNPQVAQGTAKPIHRVNFFSTGLGAVIDPYLTSPTKQKPTSFLQRRAINLLGLGLRKPLPPVAALEPWDDIGDCWCAPSGKGKAQLAVLLPRTIYPTGITIEHIPSGATLDIAAAPKDMELWAHIPNEEAREAVGDAAFPLLGTEDEHDILDNSLDRTYVRIGKWKYNIHAPNHVQTFAMAVNMQHFNALVAKVVVRAKTNWGGRDYTCLYRVRMHGKLADGMEDDIPLE